MSQQYQPSEQTQTFIKQTLQQAIAAAEEIIKKEGLNAATLKLIMGQFVPAADGMPVPEDVACQPGCSYCCHTRVSTSIPEVLVIADQLNTQLSPELFMQLTDRLNDLPDDGEPQKLEWWLKEKVACPFLGLSEAGLCAIYGLRPFACRGHHALDIEHCRKGFVDGSIEQVPCYPLLRQGIDLYTSAFIAATQKQGLPSYQVSFIPALAIAMTNSNAATEWLAGADLFRSAEIAQENR